MTYVLAVSRVKSAVREIVQQHIHPNFAGYLAVARTAANEQRTERLKPDFKAFFDDFLTVNSPPRPDRPYYRPFWNTSVTDPSDSNYWANKNVAGSYAPSSIRTDNPFRQVVEVYGSRSDARYSLLEHHTEKARVYLTANNHLPVVPLAVFLFRDYGFKTAEPALDSLIMAFRRVFGFTDDAEFEALFIDDSSSREDGKWFESMAEDVR